MRTLRRAVSVTVGCTPTGKDIRMNTTVFHFRSDAFRSDGPFFSASLRTILVLLLALAVPLQALAQCVTQNLARTGAASATSTFPGYSPARVNDGDRSTALGGAASWANARETATTPALPATVEVALAASALVDRVFVYTTAGYEIRDYNLEYFDGAQWLTIVQVRGNAQTIRSHQFTPVNVARVRVVGLSGPNLQTVHVRVNELEVCRAVAATTTVQGFVVHFGPLNPIQNVRIDLGGGLVAFTDANGFYQINNVPAGTYTIRPSRAGWTFGSTQFQNDRLTIQAVGGTISRNITGYDRNPIVYVIGWTDNSDGRRFRPVTDTLSVAGYMPFIAPIQTSLLYTPPFRTNALNVRTGIDTALYTTGQPRVILFGHSMGGLVSRTYVEGDLYRNDVSQMFTFGSPHRGIPNLVTLACVVNQPAVCQMSKPGMLLFNITHGQRPIVGYHNIGGDAPLWRRQQICFRIFGRRICIGSITLPDFTFRNFGGWLTGLLIPGGDDALAQTYSSSGMPGFIDRFITQEVHITPTLGSRDYYDWNGGNLSAQAYGQCVNPVLVQRSRTQCGGISFQPVFLPFLKQAGIATQIRSLDATSDFEQRSRLDRTRAGANQRIEREVLVDGSPTIFSAKWRAGSAQVTLIDPSGQIFDPKFAAGIIDGEPLPGEPLSDELDPNMVTYESNETAATYHFLAPRPGRWRLLVDTGADMPTGSDLETNVQFASDFGAAFANDFPFVLVGDRTQIRVTPTGAIFSGTAEAKVARLDGVVDTVALVRQNDGSFIGSYAVPNAPGNAEVSWFVSGINAGGQPFERAGNDSVQIGRRNIVVTGVGAETAVPSTFDSRNYSALVVPVSLQSDFSGEAMIAADLVDGAGAVVANVAQTHSVIAGANQITLRFSGDDLFANRRNGPYRLTNLITVDQRESGLLSDWLLDQLNTAAYDYRRFGPPTPLACGSKNLLANASASATSTFSGYSPLRAVDGDRNTALGPQYSWSNARETDSVPALPASLQVVPATAGLVEQILVYSTADWEIRDYDLEFFDGTGWGTIERVRGNTQSVREHRIPATQISALRIVCLSGPEHQAVHVRINEVEAYRCTPFVVAMPMPARTSRFFSLSSRPGVRSAPNPRIPLRR